MLKRLSRCIERLDDWWWHDFIMAQKSQLKDSLTLRECDSFFRERRSFLWKIEDVEFKIISCLPKEAWLYLVKIGKGRDFLWELENCLRSKEIGRDLGEVGSEEKFNRLKQIYVDFYNFLLTQGYDEEEINSSTSIELIELLKGGE